MKCYNFGIYSVKLSLTNYHLGIIISEIFFYIFLETFVACIGIVLYIDTIIGDSG